MLDIALGFALSVFVAPPEPPVQLIPPVVISAPPRPVKPLCAAGPVVVVSENQIGRGVFPCIMRPGQMLTVRMDWRPTIDQAVAACDSGVPHEHPNGLDFFCAGVDY